MRNKYFLLCLITLIILTLCSCIFAPSDPPSYKYRGDNVAEYAAANYSIFGMKTGEEDKVIVLEKDDYGRTMFLLRTQSWIVHNQSIAAILITQSSSDKEVQYYELNNVMYCYTDYFEPSWELCSSLFSFEQISQLKENNDWGKELNLNKAVSKKIIVSDVDAQLIQQKEIDKVIIDLYGDEDNTFYDPLTQYSNGKVVYLVGRPLYNNLDDYSEEFYIVVFFPASNLQNQKCIYEKVYDVKNYQEQLYELIR